MAQLHPEKDVSAATKQRISWVLVVVKAVVLLISNSRPLNLCTDLLLKCQFLAIFTPISVSRLDLCQ